MWTNGINTIIVILCPAGEESMVTASGTYQCFECVAGFYNLYKSLEPCLECPEGTVCDVKGMIEPRLLGGGGRSARL